MKTYTVEVHLKFEAEDAKDAAEAAHWLLSKRADFGDYEIFCEPYCEDD